MNYWLSLLSGGGYPLSRDVAHRWVAAGRIRYWRRHGDTILYREARPPVG